MIWASNLPYGLAPAHNKCCPSLHNECYRRQNGRAFGAAIRAKVRLNISGSTRRERGPKSRRQRRPFSTRECYQGAPDRKHCARAPAARPAGAPKRTRDARSRARTTPRAAASMPVLRQPHDHHRDFRARLRAEVPAHAAGANPDRHVMMPSPSIYTYRNAQRSCWLSAGTAQARIAALHSIAVARPILSRYPQIARSHRRMGPWFAASRLRRPLQSNLCKPEPAAKSP